MIFSVLAVAIGPACSDALRGSRWVCCAFSHSSAQNELLYAPQWVLDTFSQVVDQVVEQQTNYLGDGTATPAAAA